MSDLGVLRLLKGAKIMGYVDLEEFKKLRQFSPVDSGDCSAFCPFRESNYQKNYHCRLYKVEMDTSTRCGECNNYS